MIRRGDLLAELPALAAQAPPSATLVVFHSAVLVYLSAETRRAFVDIVQSLPGHWISNEGPDVLPSWSRRFGCQRVGLRHLSSLWTAHRLPLPHLMASHCTGCSERLPSANDHVHHRAYTSPGLQAW